MPHSSVIIDNLDIDRPRRTVGPFETYAPLVIDANAELSFPVTLQTLEVISRQCREVLQRSCGVELIQFHLGLPRESREGPHILSAGEVTRALVAETDNHPATIPRVS